MRYVDIIAWHDGTDGPAGTPARCVEHDGTRELRDGEVRMAVEDYRSKEPEWAAATAVWSAGRPVADPPRPPRRIRALAFFDRLPLARQAEVVAAARGDVTFDLLVTRLTAASEVDLDDPMVVDGVRALVHARIISPEEEKALLADPRPEEAV